MNENHRIEIDELLNDLVDDQATQRQETEFKRLAKHDSAIVDRLEAMRRQKRILNALPIESAPASLAEEVSSVLERKLILGDFSGDEQTIAGASHLFLRRIMTTAAMLLLPLGLLSFVVYEIMRPASVGPAIYVSTDQTLAQEDLNNSAASTSSLDRELPFNGILTFSTDRQTAVSNYVEKTVFDESLINYTVPNRTADATIYQISAPPDKIKGLIESLEKIWPLCQAVTLNVVDRSGNKAIEISQVQSEQVVALALEKDRKMIDHLAGQYALANENEKTLYAQNESSELRDIDLDASPRLAMPILTGRTEAQPQPSIQGQPTVRLRIQIRQSDE